jgi:hypothetical protein
MTTLTETESVRPINRFAWLCLYSILDYLAYGRQSTIRPRGLSLVRDFRLSLVDLFFYNQLAQSQEVGRARIFVIAYQDSVPPVDTG